MKKLFLLLFLSILGFTAYSATTDSLTLIKMQQQIQAQDSTIKAMQVKLNEVEIQKDFFGNEITIATSLFTLIVGLFSFVLGYIIPQNLKKEFSERFLKTKNDYEDLKQAVENTLNLVDSAYYKNQLDVAKIMLDLSRKENNEFSAFYWSMIILRNFQLFYKEKFELNSSPLLWWEEKAFDNMKYDVPENFSVQDVEEINTILDNLHKVADDEHQTVISNLRLNFNNMAFDVLKSRKSILDRLNEKTP